MIALAVLALLQEPPVPTDAEQRRAEAGIRDFFKTDFAKKDKASRRALSAKLLQQGEATKDDVASRYVLLREARDIAAEAGDAGTMLAAAEAMSKAFGLPRADTLTAALAVARRSASNAEDHLVVSEAYLDLGGECLWKDRYDEALRCAREAEAAAKAGKDSTLSSEAAAFARLIPEVKREQEEAAKAELALATNPDDPQANLVAGRDTCFRRGQWDRGLPLLAKSADAAVREAAQKELSKPESPAAQAEAGEAWRLAAEKVTGLYRARYQQRALEWFEKAAPLLAGLARIKAEAAIESLHKAMEKKDAVRRGLVFWVEPGRDPSDPFRELASGTRSTNHGGKLDSATRALSFAQTWVDYAASDAIRQIEKQGAIFAWIKADAYPGGGVVNRGEGAKDDFSLWTHRGGGGLFMSWPENNYPSAMYLTRFPLPTGKWVHLGAAWNERSAFLFVDGKLDAEHPLKTGVPLKRSAVVSVGSNPPGGHEYYNGLIASVMIYNRALAPAEVTHLHATGRARFR